MPAHPPLIFKGDLLLFQCLTEILNFLRLRLYWGRPQLKVDSHLDKWTVAGQCLWVLVCGKPLSALLVCPWRPKEEAALPKKPPRPLPGLRKSLSLPQSNHWFHWMDYTGLWPPPPLAQGRDHRVLRPGIVYSPGWSEHPESLASPGLSVGLQGTSTWSLLKTIGDLGKYLSLCFFMLVLGLPPAPLPAAAQYY